MTTTARQERKRTATDIDRELEKFSDNMLAGRAIDEQEFEKLLAWRRRHLVQLPTVKGRIGWHKKVPG